MQLKVATRNQVYRFDQRGQLIQKITESWVHVEAHTLDDIEGLYDPRKEHLALAFTFEDGVITGLSENYVDAIQNFLMTDSWCLQSPLDPSQDNAQETTELAAPAPEAANPEVDAPTEDLNGEPVFNPDQSQRDLLRQIHETSKALLVIRPDPKDNFAAQTQKLLISVQLFGTEDAAAATAQAEQKLVTLKAEAAQRGIPENVVVMNLAENDGGEGDLEGDTED